MATTTKQNNQYCTTSPSIDANIGPWDSISAYTSWLSGTLGVDTPQEGTEILVTNGNFNRMTKYRYETISGVARWTMVDSFYYNGLTTNADSLNSSSDVGIYFLYTAFLKGMLSVSVDFNGDIVQHLLANQTPVYENGSIASYTKGGTYLVRIYDVSTSTWSVWESVASGSSAVDAVTDVAYDSTNNKITKTVNGTTSDVVTAAALKLGMSLTKSDVGLDNVDNTADANKSVASATMAAQDANGNVITTTYETKADATTKNNAVTASIASLQSQISQIESVSGANFGGIVDASTDIASDYTDKGYSGTYFYMVGTTMTSLVAYLYTGSGSPTQLFNGATYDFTDYSDVKTEVAAINSKISVDIEGTTASLKTIHSDGLVYDATNADVRVLSLNVDNYIGETLYLSGRLFATGSYSYCWWAFHDENGNVLGKSDVSGSTAINYSNVTVVVPQNAKILYVQGNVSVLPLASAGINTALTKTQNDVNTIKFANVRSSVSTYKSIRSNGEIADAANANNRTLSAKVNGLAGKTLYLSGRLYATGSYSYCWWAFHDVNGDVLTKSSVSGTTAIDYTNVEVEVPQGAYMLYVQGNTAALPSAVTLINNVVNSVDVSGTTATIPASVRTFALDVSCISVNTGRQATSANYTNKANKHTADYIRVHDSIKLCNLGLTKQNVTIVYYDEDLAMLNYTTYSDTTNGLSEVVAEDIPSNAVWFRVSFGLHNNYVGTLTEYDKLTIAIESEWGSDEETTKEPYVEYYPFIYGVCCNIPQKIDDNPSIITKQKFGYDEGLIHLPSSYTHNGKATPLIFFLHGDAERYDIGENTFSGHMKMQQCWSNMGFAQVDLDMIPSIYNQPSLSSTGGSRDDFECISAAWLFIKNHFNIDQRGFYLIGRSRGGQAVIETLGKGGALKLPIIAAVSMAGANSIFEYSVQSVASETEWQLWCNAHGLPTTNRPRWSDSASYSTSKSFLNDRDCYNFVVNNFDLWWRKALTGWGLVVKNEDNITPRNYFDNISYALGLKNSGMGTSAEIEAYYQNMIATMEAKSPIPLRFDWCVGDTTQSRLPFTTPHSYSSMFTEILLNTPASLTEYRRWDSVDGSNPYGETNPHYAENMIFYDGDLTLPNGAVVSNPSKVTVEWMLWCMGRDPRFHITDYSLPNDW